MSYSVLQYIMIVLYEVIMYVPPDTSVYIYVMTVLSVLQAWPRRGPDSVLPTHRISRLGNVRIVPVRVRVRARALLNASL